MHSAKLTGKSTPKPEPQSCPRSYSVLLVEDEGLIARDIAQRLEALGHHVSAIVSTGEEAVEAASGVDIVLMDIRLDGTMDGIEAARTIRRRFQIPVVFLTAHADRSMVERAKQAEPFGYIVKPVAPAALHTSIEIAVHKHAMDREVIEREALLRAVLGSLADAVAVVDAQGCVRILNPAAELLTGWSEAEAQGKGLAMVVPLSTDGRAADRADPLETIVPLALLRSAPVPLERGTQLVPNGGRAIPVEGAAAPVRAGQEAVGAVLSFRDVSRRRWEERQAVQSQKAEPAARLAADVAEEYTNLLAVIRGQAERLVDQVGDYSPARQAAEEIRQAAMAAQQVTRRMAGFGKRPSAHPQVLSPNAVLRRMAKLLETVAGTDVNVTVRPGLQAGKVKVDQGQFEQLLMSLTTHAASRSAGGVRIETGSAEVGLDGAPGGYVRIAVGYSPAATGPDPSFDPASVEDESPTLSLAYNIAREHNGFFSARHMGNSSGNSDMDGTCCLEVLLPRWMEPDAMAAPGPGLTHTVLLVEPREIVRAELHKFFEANGLDLLEAADMDEAIALAEVREGPLDLVIAPASEQGLISVLEEVRPNVALLRIVDAPEQNIGELRRSYTQAALLERVRALLDNHRPDRLATAAGTI